MKNFWFFFVFLLCHLPLAEGRVPSTAESDLIPSVTSGSRVKSGTTSDTRLLTSDSWNASIMGNMAQAANLADMANVSVSGETMHTSTETPVANSYVTDELELHVREIDLVDTLVRARKISGQVDSIRARANITRHTSSGKAYSVGGNGNLLSTDPLTAASGIGSIGFGGVKTLDESITTPAGIIAEDASGLTVGGASATDATINLPNATFAQSIEYHHQQLRHQHSVHGFYAPISEVTAAVKAVSGLVHEAKALHSVIQSQRMNEAMEQALNEIEADEAQRQSSTARGSTDAPNTAIPSPSKVRQVIQETPELAQALRDQAKAKAMLQEAVRLENLAATRSQLSREGFVASLGLETPAEPLQEKATSLRLGAYRLLETMNDGLNQFAKANPKLAYYTAIALEAGAEFLHARLYYVTATTTGAVGVAKLAAMEQAAGASLQAAGASLQAAFETLADSAAASASTPEEAERFSQAVYGSAAKISAVCVAMGLVKGGKALLWPSRMAKPSQAAPKVSIVEGASPAGKATARAVGKAFEAEDVLGVKVTESGRMYGTHRKLTKAGAQDSHHVIQHAAVKDIPGYNFLDAPTVQLKGPSQVVGTEHQLATRVQRGSGGGSYAAERRIGYKALRKAGVSESEARGVINHTDQYFQQLGIKPDTKTTIPGNRKNAQ